MGFHGPGRKSSEHARALRAELAGFIAMGVGSAASITFAALHSGLAAVGAGVGICASGALLAGMAASSYAKARSSVKAAAVAKPANAPQRHV